MARYRKVLRRWRALFFYMSLAFLLSGCFGDSRTHPVIFDVSGRVLSAGTGVPISGAKVTVNGKVGMTDSQGFYSLSGVTASNGIAQFEVSAPGHIAESSTEYVGHGQTLVKDIFLTVGEAEDGGGRIYGTVNFVSYGSSAAVRQGRRSLRPVEVGVSPEDQPLPQRVIVRLRRSRDLLDSRVISSIVRTTGATRHFVNTIIHRLIVYIPPAKTPSQFLEELASSPYIEKAELDPVCQALGVARGRLFPIEPNDGAYHDQWNLPAIGLPLAWNRITSARSVIVAVIDTGVASNHPDLRGNLMNGWDFVDNPEQGGDDDPTDPGLPGVYWASHGTHVAGIIGAVGNNGIGTCGVAWNILMMPIRALDSANGGFGYLSDVASAIMWAVDHGAKVLNLSLGGDISSEPEEMSQAIDYAVQRGAILIAASGNEGAGHVLYPACDPDVIAIGASNASNEVAWYSNHGPEIDLVAPGGDYESGADLGILSTILDLTSGQPRLGFGWAEGTSMAAPHVSGVVALMLACGISPDPQMIRRILRNTAIDISATGRDDESGYGILNAYAAINHAEITETRIVVVGKDGTPVSGMVFPSDGRTFDIGRVGEGPERYIVAWLDVNGDRLLDDGDYASSVGPINLGKGQSVAASIKLQLMGYSSESMRRETARLLRMLEAR
ncbi:MAG: S8 family serine peptidase [Firmicutes bacterium]|nr:S8 family serine peptidase [Bacillota bacterium]